MRHTLVVEGVGRCQDCGETLTSRDILNTGQGRVCPSCLASHAALWETRRATADAVRPVRI